jgi:uracil-DNA glycosylase
MPETSAKSKKGKQAQLEAIAAQVSVCTLCPLWKSRTNAVPGSGNPDAAIVIIGEGPGWHEDRQGLPFVGPSGQLLDRLLGSIGIKREQVFITNVVKCRPPNNRDPMPNEIETCNPYLTAQLDIIQPRIVITLGRHSMNLFLPDAKITQVHGKPHRDKQTGLTVVPMFHPAAALRQPAWMDALTADFKKLPALLEGLSDEPLPRPAPLPADAPATAAVVEVLDQVAPVTASELPIASKPKRGRTAPAAADEETPESAWEELTGAVEEGLTAEKPRGRPRKAEPEAPSAPNEQPATPAKPKVSPRRQKEEEAGQLTLF